MNQQAVETLENLAIIDEGIYRSAIVNAANFWIVKELEIKTIICLKTNPIDVVAELKLARDSGITFKHIPIQIIMPGGITERSFQVALTELVESKKPVLLHCTRGADRTGIVSALYRIHVQGWSYEKAVEEMDARGFNQAFNFWKPWLKEHAKVEETKQC